MADPFSVAGSAVGVVSLGISVCQGVAKYYSAYKGQDYEVDEMVGKVERLTNLLEILQHRLTGQQHMHSVSVDKVEQNIIACTAAVRRLHEILSKCTQECMVEEFRHTTQAISRKMLYPFKQKTLQNLSAAVSQCQRDLATAMQILQIDQLSTINSSNAAILKNTTTTSEIIENHSHEIMAMREDIQRLMEVAVPALVLSSMRPQTQGNARNTALTVLSMPSATKKRPASRERGIMGQKSSLSLCRCRPRTKFIERRFELGPITLIRTSKSRLEHNKDCQYFVPKIQNEGAGVRLQIKTMSRRWSIMATMNYNHTVGAFSINPTLVFKATVPDNHPLFLVTKEVIRGKVSFEAGLRYIRLLFQNNEAAPNDVNNDGANVLQVALESICNIMDDGIAGYGAFQKRVRQLIMAFLAFGVNVNERLNGWHILDVYLLLLIEVSDRGDDFSFLHDLRDNILMHRDCDYDPGSYAKMVEREIVSTKAGYSMYDFVQTDEDLANELGLNSLCQGVIRKSLGGSDSILSQSPSELSSNISLEPPVLRLAADWPIGMATLLSMGGTSLVRTLDMARQYPLDYTCHYDCASVVKLVIEANCRIDPELLRCLEEQSKWELLQIFVEELARRRNSLKHFAETQLPESKYRELEIRVEHPMNDIQTVLVLSELEKNSIQIPEVFSFYGIEETPAYRPANLFGSSFGNTSKGANIVCNAGFLPAMHVDESQEYQLRGQLGRFYKNDWPRNRSIAQHLDKMLWLLENGLTISEDQVHHMFNSPNSILSLEDTRDDMIYSYRERMDLLSHLLSSRSGMQHTCPCCIDVCSTLLATLKSERGSPDRDIKDPKGETIIFTDLLVLIEECENRLDPQFWVWAMPRLIHSVLFEVCRLTHSPSCCKRAWRNSEEHEVKEKHEKEAYMRSRIRTLTKELTAEYKESSMSLSDFLQDRVVVRGLELVSGEEDASTEEK